VVRAYPAANNGHPPGELLKMLSYATTPAQQSALQLAIMYSGSDRK
jgi:hypothetical protein